MTHILLLPTKVDIPGEMARRTVGLEWTCEV